jgi:hypothetical protein
VSWRLALLLAAALVAGCGDADPVDRNSYVENNVALLKTVPAFPGAKPGPVDSEPYKNNEQPDAETIGYGTTRADEVPAATRPSAAIAFYRRALRARRWKELDVSAAPSVSLRKGDAYLHVLAGRGGVDLEIDHDCYKGGPSPMCFGP